METQIPIFLHYGAAMAAAARVLMRPRLEPSARLAWVLVIAALPIVGIAAYVLFGEVRVGRAELRARRGIRARLAALYGGSGPPVADLPDWAAPVAASCHAVGGMPPVGGNRIALLDEGDGAIDALVAAIDGAHGHVHLLFYIWLPDVAGSRVAAAAIRAANRGVAVRVIVDAFGSRAFMRSPWWPRLQEAGVECRAALPVGIPMLRVLVRRLDLRNHRKIVVIDGDTAFTGSRNCADMEFRPKRRFAPWVDILVRIDGPAARQMQAAFLADWLGANGDDRPDLLSMPGPAPGGEVAAQVIPTGPDWRGGSMSDCLNTLIHAARDSITITTPYYVPDEALDAAIRSAARRGVRVRLILPRRNDSMFVAATNEGFWRGLIDAGVDLYLFGPGLLHAKIITVDGRMAVIGSANLDRRSFELNYELNLFLPDPDITAALDARQDSYLDRAHRVVAHDVRRWPWWRRLRNNVLALAAPLL